MVDSVNAWRQSGNIYVWRYDKPGSSRRGWHFTADPLGCASINDLIERMKAAAVPCYRTLSLATVTPAIWGVPNFGPPKRDRFAKLRINYAPQTADMSLTEHDDRLDLSLGTERSVDLTAAFADVAVGLGDFGVGISDDKRAECWMFWWMPVARRR